MKKIICMTFAVLFAFSVISMTAFAADTDAPFALAERISRNDSEFIMMDKGETYTLNYKTLVGRKNVTVPKGGYIQWYVLYYGGMVDGKCSADDKTCTITAKNGGSCVVSAFVYDAKRNELSHDVMNVHVNYSGILGTLDELSGHFICSRIFDLCRLFIDFMPFIALN